MASTNNLTFTKSDRVYKATFVSGGLCTVQMKRKTIGNITVSANINGMDAVPVSNQMYYNSDVIFNIDVPSGLQVTVTSDAEVTDAKIYVA